MFLLYADLCYIKFLVYHLRDVQIIWKIEFLYLIEFLYFTLHLFYLHTLAIRRGLRPLELFIVHSISFMLFYMYVTH